MVLPSAPLVHVDESASHVFPVCVQAFSVVDVTYAPSFAPVVVSGPRQYGVVPSNALSWSKNPGVIGVQLLAPEAASVSVVEPGSHCRQVICPATWYLPGTHETQGVDAE